jgi:hypothetical protein
MNATRDHDEGHQMLRTKILALACVSAFALTGCSSTDDAPGAGNSAPPGASGGASTDSAPADSGGANSGGVSASALCDYLKGELPKLQSLSKVGAYAQLAIGLAGFFDKAGKPADGAEMDELTTKECPSVRTDVLNSIGKDAFAEI